MKNYTLELYRKHNLMRCPAEKGWIQIYQFNILCAGRYAGKIIIMHERFRGREAFGNETERRERRLHLFNYLDPYENYINNGREREKQYLECRCGKWDPLVPGW